MSNIPVLPPLDGSKYFDGTPDERTQFCNDLMDGLKRFGFVRLSNHGLSGQVAREAFD